MKKTAAKKVTDREDQEGKHLCSFSFLGSDSEYSGEEEDEEDLEDEDSASGTSLYGKDTWTEREREIIRSLLEVSENLGSDEESGKSWSELEEEARKGLLHAELVVRFSNAHFYSISGC